MAMHVLHFHGVFFLFRADLHFCHDKTWSEMIIYLFKSSRTERPLLIGSFAEIESAALSDEWEF